MTNDELDRAIKTAHGLLYTTTKGEQYDTIQKHLESLLKIQKDRALAKPSTPEPSTE